MTETRWHDAVRFVEPEALAAAARALGPVQGFLRLVERLPGQPRDAEAEEAAFRSAQEALGLPDHLAFCLSQLVRRAEAGEGALPDARCFDSIPFHDVCYGLLLPLSGLAPARALRVFGLRGPVDERLDAKGRRALVLDFLGYARFGLTLLDKVALVRADPFLGQPLGTSLNVLLDVLASLHMIPASRLREEIGRTGDVQELFVHHCPRHRSDPPLTTREVLLSLRLLKQGGPGGAGLAPPGRSVPGGAGLGPPGRSVPVARKRQVIASLLARMGRLETYFTVGFLRQGSRLNQTLGDEALLDALAAVTGADRARLDVARSLVDVFELTRIVEEEGAAGLAKLTLRPLSPLAPMLAGPEVPGDQAFPVFFEKKYDGVRLMVHKATAPNGRVRVAAFTRRRLEWTEQLPGLLPLGHALPCRDVILDGELHGTVLGPQGAPRPATVYDITKAVRGERDAVPLRFRFAAFDLVYVDGRDLTCLPLSERRAALQRLVAPATLQPLPLPLELSDGELVASRQDMLRLYELFRSQGYEGGIAKDPASPYELGKRSAAWTKLKPALTLDLAVTGALYTTSAGGPGAAFGTYLVAALGPDGGLREVGRVQGLGALDSAEVVRTILEEGLLTGRTLTRETSTGLKAGVELRPGIVATVRFEGVVRDETQQLALRDPKILRVRTGEKDLSELDRYEELERLFLREGLR